MAKPPARTNVTVPIKIVIGRDIDGDRLSDNVAIAAGKQLGRALNVLDERGPWQGTLAQLDIQFKQDAGNLTEERKRELRAYVGDGLARGTEVAQTHRGSGGDPARAKTKGKGLSKKGRADDQKPKAKAASRFKPVAEWLQFSGDSDPAIKVAFHDAAKDWLIEKDRRDFPTTYGMLLRLQGKVPVQLWVVRNGEYVCRAPLTVVDWSSPTAGGKPKADRPDPFNLYLEQESDGYAKYRSRAIENTSKRLAETQGKVGEVKSQPGGAEEPQRQWTADVEKVVDTYMSGWDTEVLVYYWLHGLGPTTIYPFLKSRYPAMPVLSRIEVVALVQIRQEEDVEAEEAVDGAGALSIPDLPDPAGGGDGGKGEGGGADKGAGLGSDATAPPGQDVGEGGRGVVKGPKDNKRGSIFPNVSSDPNGQSAEMPCQPYDGEPSARLYTIRPVETLRLIGEIARRLDMDECPFAANFCLQASRMLRIRALQVQTRFTLDDSGDFSDELSVGTLDSAGRFRFKALDSVAVQYLQHLAGTIPKIRQLIELVFMQPYPVTRFTRHHWFEAVMDEATQACGLIWLSANQVMMQQLLNSSRHAVLQRKGNAGYSQTFAMLCKVRLADHVEMIMLRTSLEQFVSIAGDRKGADAYAYVREHLALKVAIEGMNRGSVDDRKLIVLEQYGSDADLVTRLSDETEYVFHRGRTAGKPIADAGAIVESTDGRWVIRASDGTLYDKTELNAIIAVGQQVVTSFDPLINQLINRLVTAIRPLVDDPDRIPAFLDKVFADMLAKNDEAGRKNKADLEYAFEHAQIHKVDRDSLPTVELAATQVRGWQLGGIHAQAHLHVGVCFKGDPFYVAAVARLIGQEYYWRSFAEDMIFIFGIAFTIICPPLGVTLSFAANFALGAEKYAKAKEQETIYGALINPEEVLNYAEIQIDLFLAKLQIALSFLELLPLAGKGIKAIGGLGKRGVAEGARRGLRQIAKEAVMEELERIAKVSSENFIKALAFELVEETIEDKIVDLLVTPIIMDQIRTLENELHDEGLL